MRTRKTDTGLLIILTLVLLVKGVYVFRGSPKAIEVEPSKIRGPRNAPISIVEFSDFQCPYCKAIQPALKQVLDKHPKDVNLVFKHFPLDFIHSNTRKASEAAECAGDQGKFYPYHDILFEKVIDWFDPPNLENRFIGYAKEIGLNEQTFKQCFESGVKKGVVQENKEEGRHLFVTGTPTLLLNGTRVLTSHSYEAIEAAIQSELSGKKSL